MAKKEEVCVDAPSGVKKCFSFWKLAIIVASITIIVGIIAGFILLSGDSVCGDRTALDSCSENPPYFCEEGKLVEKASFCGCPSPLYLKNNECTSDYFLSPKFRTFDYSLRGENYELDLEMHKGVNDYFLSLPQSIYYDKNVSPSRADFKKRKINESFQKVVLLPLVVKIQNSADNPKDQVRIAVSLVQNIEYDSSGQVVNLAGKEILSSGYPYNVLYNQKGFCEGKSELLAFLLKELGYGVALFYYPDENHEAVGVKCPLEHSLNDSGYCFIESTGPAIISNSEHYYSDWGKLSSNFQIVVLAEGNSLEEDMYEYKDADNLVRLDKIIDSKGELNFFRKIQLNNLIDKYGLENIYS